MITVIIPSLAKKNLNRLLFKLCQETLITKIILSIPYHANEKNYNYKNKKIKVFKNAIKHQVQQRINSQNYVESNNAKVLFFPWLPLEKEIVKRSIVDIRRDSAVEYLGDTYFIDKGFHISSAGHKTLAEEYIYPMIRSNFE